MSRGLVILSHGLESGPQANKVSALAVVAEALGWDSVRPDYRDLDATEDPARICDRKDRLLANLPDDDRPVVFAGSSMGAFISARASLEHKPLGLFLIAPPVGVPRYPEPLEVAPVPLWIVHGWHDELIDVADVVEFARPHSARLLLLDGDHRLTDWIDEIGRVFADFLRALDPD